MVLSSGREIGIVVAAACTLWIAVRVFRSARRLNAGVRAFKEEQEKQDGVVDPYAALSSLYTPATKEPVKASNPTTERERSFRTRLGRRD